MKEKTFRKTVFETSRRGGRFHEVPQATVDGWENPQSEVLHVQVNADDKRQRIEGFGGSFTDASAYLVHQLSAPQRDNILKAYFAEEGANYSLTRTHMNSCDFSRFHYSYAEVEGDLELEHFNMDQDREFLFPMIRAAQNISKRDSNSLPHLGRLRRG